MNKVFLLGATALSLLIAAPAMAAPASHGNSNAQHQSQNKQSVDNHRNVNRGPAANRAPVAKPRAATPPRAAANQKARQFHYNGQNRNAFRAPAWHAPKGYRAAKWNRGQYLPAAYRSRGYVVNHRAYHLNAAPRGYNWVRVNNDVYLVSARNGFISQSVLNIFFN